MPKQRITPGSGLTPAQRALTAPPQDTFNPFAGQGAKRRLDDLSRSLESLGRAGTSFYQQEAKRQDKEDAVRGQQAFLEAMEQQQNVADAIRQARMRPGASQWFRYGVEAQAGGVSARQARDHFMATQGEALEEADTLEEFDQLAGQSLDEYRETLGETSEAFDNGFMPTYMAQLEELRYQFAVGIDGKLTSELVNDFGANLYDQLKMIDALGEATMFHGIMGYNPYEGLGAMAAAAAITRDMDALALSNPGTERAIKDTVFETLQVMARETGDRSYLEIARNIRVGPAEQGERRTSLWSERNQEFQAASEKLTDLQRVQNNDAWVQAGRDEVRATEAAQQDVAMYLADDSLTSAQQHAKIERRIDTLALTHAGQAKVIRSEINQRRDFSDFTDPDTYEWLVTGLFTGDATRVDVIASRGVLKKNDYLTLMGHASSLSADGAYTDPVFDLDVVNRWEKQINPTRFAGLFGDMIADDSAAADQALAIYTGRIALRREELRAIAAAEGQDSPRLLAIVEQEFNDAIESTMRSFQHQMTEQMRGDIPPTAVGVLGGVALTPQQTAERFTPQHIKEMTEAIQAVGPNGERDPELQRFINRWNRWRPDAPYGTTQFGDALVEVHQLQAEHLRR